MLDRKAKGTKFVYGDELFIYTITNLKCTSNNT